MPRDSRFSRVVAPRSVCRPIFDDRSTRKKEKKKKRKKRNNEKCAIFPLPSCVPSEHPLESTSLKENRSISSSDKANSFCFGNRRDRRSSRAYREINREGGGGGGRSETAGGLLGKVVRRQIDRPVLSQTRRATSLFNSRGRPVGSKVSTRICLPELRKKQRGSCTTSHATLPVLRRPVDHVWSRSPSQLAQTQERLARTVDNLINLVSLSL